MVAAPRTAPPGRPKDPEKRAAVLEAAVAADPDRSRIETALGRVGLGHLDGLPAAYLSAGQRRRLSRARLLAAEGDLAGARMELFSITTEAAIQSGETVMRISPL
mgnify:CR=1 FL=1